MCWVYGSSIGHQSTAGWYWVFWLREIQLLAANAIPAPNIGPRCSRPAPKPLRTRCESPSTYDPARDGLVPFCDL